MKFRSFVVSTICAAVVCGALLTSPSVAFSCGGGAGQTGCKVATSPLLLDSLIGAIRWLDLVIP